MRSAHVYSVAHAVIRPALAAAACLVAALAAAPSPARARCIVAKVNGEAITNDEVGQRSKFNMLAHHKRLPRKDIIEELIDDRLKVQTARSYEINVTEKDVDQQYADMATRMHMVPERVTQALNQSGVNISTLKAKILVDMGWQYVIRGKLESSLQVDEKRVNAEVESQKKSAEAEVTYDYTLTPILFLVPSGDAELLEARRKEADALRARFTSCEAGLADARTQPDVMIRPPITKNSSFFPPPLRELLNKIEIGHLTPPETIAQSVQLFALCSKKETGIHPPDTWEKRAADEKLFASRFEALSKDYLAQLRRSAKTEFMQRCRPRLN
jgi:peptidyl-prolyl cis-trans isomerase SurA